MVENKTEENISRIIRKEQNNFTKEEKAVLKILLYAYRIGERLLVSDIVESKPWVGCNIEYSDKGPQIEQEEDAAEKVLDSLINKYHLPIKKEDNKYWIPKNE